MSALPKPRLVSLHRLAQSVRALAGAIVSVGSGQGGTALMLADGAQYHNNPRSVWVFDTWDSIVAPDERDGERALERYTQKAQDYAPVDPDAVVAMLQASGIERVEPLFEPLQNADGALAKRIGGIRLLHIDCDWYAPTLAALEAFYDSVVSGGIVICDDHGHWEGARKAIEEFREQRAIASPIIGIDYTCCWWIKP